MKKMLRRISENKVGCLNTRCWNVTSNGGEEPGYHLTEEEWAYILPLVREKFGRERGE